MSFLFKLLGKDGATQCVVDSKHEAARVSHRPMEIGTRGSYAAAFGTGVLPAALGANSEIFQFRFVSASGFFCLLRSVTVDAAVSTTAFVAGVPPVLEMRIARNWTVQGTLGTGITWGTDDGKKRTDFATTVLGANDVRIATTAALGAGTKTLDGTALARRTGNTGGATVTTQIIPPGTVMWQRNTGDEYPVLLENQEGFVIRSVQVPATGTWQCGVQVEWSELDPSAITGWS